MQQSSAAPQAAVGEQGLPPHVAPLEVLIVPVVAVPDVVAAPPPVPPVPLLLLLPHPASTSAANAPTPANPRNTFEKRIVSSSLIRDAYEDTRRELAVQSGVRFGPDHIVLAPKS
jgi:hypothetical protein